MAESVAVVAALDVHRTQQGIVPTSIILASYEGTPSRPFPSDGSAQRAGDGNMKPEFQVKDGDARRRSSFELRDDLLI